MNFGQAIASGFRNFVNFSDRAVRSEYWLWVLFTVIGGLAAGILDAAMFFHDGQFSTPLNAVFNLITFLLGMAMCVRRLHDIDRTGWWILLALTIVGAFVLVYWACKRGTAGSNRFGPDPFAAPDKR